MRFTMAIAGVLACAACGKGSGTLKDGSNGTTGSTAGVSGTSGSPQGQGTGASTSGAVPSTSGTVSGSSGSTGATGGTGPCSGPSVFCDDYSNSALASAYTNFQGTWSRAAGALTAVDATAFERARSTLSYDATDFDVTLHGSSRGDSGFGLVYAASASADDGYAVLIHPAQYQGIYLKKLGPASVGDVNLASTPLATNMAGQPLVVRIQRQSGTVTVWLNGTQMLSASDLAAGIHGRVGLLLSDTNNTANAGAVFSLLRVDSLSLASGSTTTTSGTNGTGAGTTTASSGTTGGTGTATTTGGASGGTVPTDGQGVTAHRIADMMEIFGANVFSNGQDGESGQTVAGLTAAAQYLLGNSGLTMLFRGYLDNASEYATFGPALFEATGCRFTLCMGIGDSPDPSQVIALAKASTGQGHWIQFIEGGNEPNTNFGAGVQTGVSAATELPAVQQIYAAVHPLGIPVATSSVVGNYNDIAGYWGSDLAGAVAASDLYNTHMYPNNGGPNGSNQFHDWSAAVSQSDWNGKPGIMTEWQPVLYNSDATDDQTAAYWSPITLLSGYVDHQLEAIVWFEMFDYQNAFNVHVGLFNGTVASPYPAAKALKSMFGLTGDTGADKRTFVPGQLDITVDGLPTGDNPYNGGRSAVFQNSSGEFFVFVWNEQNALNTGTSTPVTVTFKSGPMLKVVDYSLTNPATDAPTPIQTLTNVSSVKLDLTTEVRLLQVTHP